MFTFLESSRRHFPSSLSESNLSDLEKLEMNKLTNKNENHTALYNETKPRDFNELEQVYNTISYEQSLNAQILALPSFESLLNTNIDYEVEVKNLENYLTRFKWTLKFRSNPKHNDLEQIIHQLRKFNNKNYTILFLGCYLECDNCKFILDLNELLIRLKSMFEIFLNKLTSNSENQNENNLELNMFVNKASFSLIYFVISNKHQCNNTSDTNKNDRLLTIIKQYIKSLKLDMNNFIEKNLPTLLKNFESNLEQNESSNNSNLHEVDVDQAQSYKTQETSFSQANNKAGLDSKSLSSDIKSDLLNNNNNNLILKAINKRKLQLSCPLCSSRVLNMSDHLLKKHAIKERNLRKSLMDKVKHTYLTKGLDNQQINSANLNTVFSAMSKENKQSVEKSTSNNSIKLKQKLKINPDQPRKLIKCPKCDVENKYFVNISDHLIKIHHLVTRDMRKPILRKIKQQPLLYTIPNDQVDPVKVESNSPNDDDDDDAESPSNNDQSANNLGMSETDGISLSFDNQNQTQSLNKNMFEKINKRKQKKTKKILKIKTSETLYNETQDPNAKFYLYESFREDDIKTELDYNSGALNQILNNNEREVNLNYDPNDIYPQLDSIIIDKKYSDLADNEIELIAEQISNDSIEFVRNTNNRGSNSEDINPANSSDKETTRINETRPNKRKSISLMPRKFQEQKFFTQSPSTSSSSNQSYNNLNNFTKRLKSKQSNNSYESSTSLSSLSSTMSASSSPLDLTIQIDKQANAGSLNPIGLNNYADELNVAKIMENFNQQQQQPKDDIDASFEIEFNLNVSNDMGDQQSLEQNIIDDIQKNKNEMADDLSENNDKIYNQNAYCYNRYSKQDNSNANSSDKIAAIENSLKPSTSYSSDLISPSNNYDLNQDEYYPNYYSSNITNEHSNSNKSSYANSNGVEASLWSRISSLEAKLADTINVFNFVGENLIKQIKSLNGQLESTKNEIKSLRNDIITSMSYMSSSQSSNSSSSNNLQDTDNQNSSSASFRYNQYNENIFNLNIS